MDIWEYTIAYNVCVWMYECDIENKIANITNITWAYNGV